MSAEPTELIGFLEPYPSEVRDLALEGRQFLLDYLSPVTELHFDATSAVCAGFCYTNNARDNFVNLAVYAKHVTLIFPWGVLLSDPEGRLNGEGKQVRNIRLKNLDSLKEPYILNLIDQSSKNATQPASDFEPTTIIKIYEGPKRRPQKT